MSEPHETFEHNGKVVKIYYDDDPMSPRDADNLGVMLADGHPNYDLGDAKYHGSDYDLAQTALHELAEEGKIRQFPNWLKHNLGSTCVIALGLIDHSGISMYAIGSNLIEADATEKINTAHPMDPGGWDSGMVGFIFDTKASRDMCGTPEDLIEECLRSEVEEYDNYLTGDVHGYVIEDTEGNELASCWGFIGEEYAIAEAKREAENIVTPEPEPEIDIREFGFEVYANDEDDDPNPGIIVDTREWKGKALTPAQTRALAKHLTGLADYMEGKQ